MKKTFVLSFSLVMLLIPSLVLGISRWTFFHLTDQGDGSAFIGTGKKVISVSGGWKLRSGGDFTPDVGAGGDGPMLRIKGCDVTVDFNDYCINNADAAGKLVIALEIGHRKDELDADPTLQQISNVTILNGSFTNFDVGIIVHKGVKNVTIENCNFLKSSYGLIFMGHDDTQADRISTVKVKDCIICGHGKDKQTVLAALKTKIEGSSVGLPDCEYDYGTDSFMPVRQDTLNGDVLTAYTYGGIFARHVKGLCIDNCLVQDIGYENFATTSEGNGVRTEAVGVICRQCREVTMNDSRVYCILSELKAVCLQLEVCKQVYLKKCEYSHNRSAQKAVGIECFDVTDALDATVEEFDLYDVKCEMHTAEKTIPAPSAIECCYGIDLSKCIGVTAKQVSCENNVGKTNCSGLWSVRLCKAKFEHCSFSKNTADRATNDIAASKGIIAAGVSIDDGKVVEFDDCSFDKNVGKNAGVGLYCSNMVNCHFNQCNFLRNEGQVRRSGEEAAIRTEQDGQEISKYGPVVDSTCTGGYGFVCIGSGLECERLYIHDCIAEANTGHRSAGFWLQNCNTFEIECCSASYQYANGDLLHADILGGDATFRDALPIISHHIPLLFSNACGVDNSLTSVNVKNALNDYLNNVENLRCKQDALDCCDTITYTLQRDIVAAITLLKATVARFRLWGTAYGIHIHNGKKFRVDDCHCIGQKSLCDNAIGLCLTGRNSEFEIAQSNCSFNEGWTQSARTSWATTPDAVNHPSQYDLTSAKDFWWMGIGRNDGPGWKGVNEDSTAIGFRTKNLVGDSIPTVLVAQGEQPFCGFDLSNPWICPIDTSPLISAFGPTGAGIVGADLCVNGCVVDCLLKGNRGNAGHGFGLEVIQGYGLTVDKNRVLVNSANIYGFAVGILDVTSNTSNVYTRNFLTTNKVKNYPNANVLVPVKTGSFPGVALFNTDFYGDYNPATFNNVEIWLKKTDSCWIEDCEDGSIADGLYTAWNSGSWVA